jgi:hypothetical protein
MLVAYPEGLPLRDARRIYFDANNFGPDGGYASKWVDFKLGKIPFPVPNTAGRVRAVRFHDLHHVLTGYDTNTIGEFEISAWEIAAGCKDFAAAWALNFSGMFAGALVAPGRMFRAFARGRRSRTCYGEPFEPLLELTVAEARARYVAAGERVEATAADAIVFAGALLAGAAVGVSMAAVCVPLAPIGLLALWVAGRRRAGQSVGGAQGE